MRTRRRSRWIRSIIAATLGLAAIIAIYVSPLATHAQTEPDRMSASRDGPVWVIPIVGDIDLGLAAFVERSVVEAEDQGAAFILVEVNTFGGRVDAATQIRDALIQSKIPVAAWVKERAWSAGALIALAADSLWMGPGASIGAAEPRPADEKTVSALRAEFESTAEHHGRDPLIAAAMVDQRVVIPDISEKDAILTLSAHQAVDVGYADGLASSRDQIKEFLGRTHLPDVSASPNWAERAARFLTAPVISEVLLTLGILGLIAEVTSPGFGVPGTAGVSALLLFFGGRYVVGLVGWEGILLFALGMILLALEIFAIPGFGIVGILGIASMLTSFGLSFGSIDAALRSLGIVTLMTVVGAVILWRFGRRRDLWSRMILRNGGGDAESYPDYSRLEGRHGRTITALRPAGVIALDGERVDAVSEGAYIPANQPVVVHYVEGHRIVVRAVEEE